jgi:hypothetical protein
MLLLALLHFHEALPLEPLLTLVLKKRDKNSLNVYHRLNHIKEGI